MRAFFIGAPAAALEATNWPPPQVAQYLEGRFDYHHLWVRTVEDFEAGLLQPSTHLDLKGSLWVSWPKGGQLSTDLTLIKATEPGDQCGLVEGDCLSIDALWSALKFPIQLKAKPTTTVMGE